MNRISISTKHYVRTKIMPYAACLIAALSPSMALAHDIEPEAPLDRRPNLEFIKEIKHKGTGFISGSGGKGYEWHYYKNYSYACGRQGFHTFLIANPVSTSPDVVTKNQDTEVLPLLIRFRGGGVGYFDEFNMYHGNGEDVINNESPAQSPLDEESPEAMQSNLLTDGLMKIITADDETNFRILVISYCDHDIYSGVGEIDPGNPFPPVDNPLTPDTEELPRTTAGLLAAKAAFQYTKDHYPTRNHEVVLYGTSAGGVGVLNFSTSFGRKGISFAGAISDSGNESPWAEDLVKFDCIPWMRPAESFFSGLSSRIGPYMGPRVSAISAIIDQTLLTPVFMIWSRGDKSSCGETEIAIDSDGDGWAEMFWAGSEVSWRPLARVIDSHNPGGASRWLRVCVQDEVYQGEFDGPCDQHSPTLYDKTDSDAFYLRSPNGNSQPKGQDPRRTYTGNYNDEIYTWILNRIGR